MNKLSNLYSKVMGLDHPNPRRAEFNAMARPIAICMLAVAAYKLANYYDVIPRIDIDRPSVTATTPKL